MTSLAAKHPSLAYLALGSNLGDRAGHLTAARQAISALPSCTLRQWSSLYETPAWGSDKPQPDYLNAVIALETGLTPHELWQHTSAIELSQGRARSAEKNAARTLDIDLLLFDDMLMNTNTLVLPHPRMHLRQFVLQPLLEIAPDINIPGRGSAAALSLQLVGSDLQKVTQNSVWN